LNKPDDQELRERLTDMQYKVTQGHGTEAPFSGELNDNKSDGKYLCVVCGAHLFDSETKFDSGSGWPSFYDVAVTENLEETRDSNSASLKFEPE